MGLKKEIISTLVSHPSGLTARQICDKIGYPIDKYAIVETLISQINYNEKKWDGIYINTNKVTSGDDIYKLVTVQTSTVAELEDFANQRARRIEKEIRLCEKFSGIPALTNDARVHRIQAAILAQALNQRQTDWIAAMMDLPTVTVKPVAEIKATV